jgi:GNAT superfamily N-acetyltransferase
MTNPAFMTDTSAVLGTSSASMPQESPITVRDAVLDDAAAIGAVFDAAVRASWTYLGDLIKEPLFTADDWRKLVADHMAPNLLLVAVDNVQRIVGYTAAHSADGELFLLFVHPAWTGHGVGRALLAAAHSRLREANCQEAFLFVHEQNARALAVYAAAGYRPDGSDRVSDFRGMRIRELRLIKHL